MLSLQQEPQECKAGIAILYGCTKKGFSSMTPLKMSEVYLVTFPPKKVR